MNVRKDIVHYIYVLYTALSIPLTVFILNALWLVPHASLYVLFENLRSKMMLHFILLAVAGLIVIPVDHLSTQY